MDMKGISLFINTRMCKYYLSLFLISFTVNLSAQIVSFESLDMSDGLSSSNVYCINQDSYGFIWIGTNNGLNIYNGIDFNQYFRKPGDINSLPGNSIEKIIFDGDTAFIATRTGLCMMDVVSKQYVQMNTGTNKFIRTLFHEKEKNLLWVGTQTGLLKYDLVSQQYEEYNVSNSNISHNVIRSIYRDTQGDLWIGTFDKLNRLTGNSSIIEHITFNEIGLSAGQNNLILSIEPYSKKNDSLLWIGTQTGLVLYSRAENNFEQFIDEESGLSNSVIKTIQPASNGRLWLGTDFGLVELQEDKVKDIYVHDPYKRSGLANSVVWDAFEDQSGTLWFGTGNGVSILSKSTDRFNFYPLVFNIKGVRSGYDIRSIVEDKNGHTWMATQNGFIKYNPTDGKILSFNSNIPLLKDVNSIFADSENNIWAATNGGISYYNTKSKRLQNYISDMMNSNSLRSNYIHNFIETSQEELYVNTSEGLHRIQEDNGQISFPYIGNTGIMGIGKDYLWIVENYSELTRIDPETFVSEVVIDIPFKHSNSYVFSLLSDTSRSNIWIGYNNGLFLYNTELETYKFFDIPSDKDYPLISMLIDDEGNIWASSYWAIIKFSVVNKEFEIYPSGDAISISRFFENSCYKSRGGKLFFGGQDGYLSFYPNTITKSDYSPPLRFTKLVIANNEILPSTSLNDKYILDKDISFTNEIVLDYVDGSFGVEFSSLHYGNRNGIRYKYMLEGEEYDWNYIDNSRGRASYSKIMPGTYRLRVQGTNNDGVWKDNELIMNIRIKPPLWASAFFIIVYVLIIIITTIILARYFLNRSRWKSQMEIIRLEKEHTETVAKNRQQFFTNVAHEFRTPLNLIIGPAEKIISNKSTDKEGLTLAHLIERNARRLMWLNNQFLDIRKIENKTIQTDISEFEIISFLRAVFLLFKDQAESHKIKYLFKHDVESIMVKMDLRQIETIVFNLLSNAFKYTNDEGEIILQISMLYINQDEKVRISIKDSGIGIPEEEQSKVFGRFYQIKENKNRGLGIGLNLVKEYVSLHNGETGLISTPGMGSEFLVTLPVNESQEIGESNPDTIQPILKNQAIQNIPYKSVNLELNSPNILLLEDDVELADFLTMSLAKQYQVTVVRNGVMALQEISSIKPDLIISDINMPEMDGIEFTKKLKGNPKTAHIPLIIISGEAEKERQKTALKEGANAYLVKPLEIELLELRIENFLKRGDQLAELYKINKLSEPSNTKISSQDEKIIERVVVCIEKNISDPELDVNKVCEECGFSHTFLYRKVKKITGQTLKELIRTVRLKRAEQLLRTKKLSVSEVMHETGFSNRSYFSKCFKTVYHKTPREYRQDY
jgi:signal transduction histidine kinase/ligand-binding sensor domain-containing protein/AraC-like DNA-binding protein